MWDHIITSQSLVIKKCKLLHGHGLTKAFSDKFSLNKSKSMPNHSTKIKKQMAHTYLFMPANSYANKFGF